MAEGRSGHAELRQRRSEEAGEKAMTMRLEDMTWRDAADAVRAGVPLVLPVGSLEQHGHHLPLGTDTFLVRELARRVAERVPLVIAPPLFFAARSQPRSGGYGRAFAGTAGISGGALTQLCLDVVEDFLRQGFRKLLVLNGHYENASFVFEALQALADRNSDTRLVLVNWWEQLVADDLAQAFPEGFPGWEVEHAGVVETSLMEALLATKVRPEMKTDSPPLRRLTYDVLPTPHDVVPPTGVPYRSLPASAELGRRLAERLVERVSKIVKDEFGSPLEERA